jgi:hypothetical protein
MARIWYRTRGGQADYQFDIVWVGDEYRAYIEQQPSYGNRDTGAHPTHRLSEDGRYFVCWTESLQSEADARSVAAMWADATQEYIRTGRRF